MNQVYPKASSGVILRNVLLGAGILSASMSLMLKLVGVLTINQVFNASNFSDFMAVYGEVKTAAMILGISLLLDSVAVLAALLAIIVNEM